MVRLNKSLVFVALLTASSLTAAQAYKCKDSTGAVKYQQSPCSTPSEEKVRLFYDPSPEDSDSRSDSLAQGLAPAVRARFDAQVAERQVAVGMTAPMVKKAWGVPKSINSSLRASGRSEQWVYRNEYVYFENGIVSSIQTSR